MPNFCGEDGHCRPHRPAYSPGTIHTEVAGLELHVRARRERARVADQPRRQRKIQILRHRRLPHVPEFTLGALVQVYRSRQLKRVRPRLRCRQPTCFFWRQFIRFHTERRRRRIDRDRLAHRRARRASACHTHRVQLARRRARTHRHVDHDFQLFIRGQSPGEGAHDHCRAPSISPSHRNRGDPQPPSAEVAVTPAGSVSVTVTGSPPPSTEPSPTLLALTTSTPSPPGGRFVGREPKVQMPPRAARFRGRRGHTHGHGWQRTRRQHTNGLHDPLELIRNHLSVPPLTPRPRGQAPRGR